MLTYLRSPDVARYAMTSRDGRSAAQLMFESSFAAIVGASAPAGWSLHAQSKFLERLSHRSEPDNLQYLITWAITDPAYTPFLHHLLLLREEHRVAVRLGGGVCVVEEELRLAGEEDPPPPEPPSEEYTRLYNYSRGVNFNPVWGFTTPLILAVQQGNIDAVSLLLLFGEPVNDTVKGSPPPLYVAVETGNVRACQLLLGREPLRPPEHKAFIAKRLGLLSPAVGAGLDLVWRHCPAPRPIDGSITPEALYTRGWSYNPFMHGLRMGTYWDPVPVTPQDPAPFTLTALTKGLATAPANTSSSSPQDLDPELKLALSLSTPLQAYTAGVVVSQLEEGDVLPPASRTSSGRPFRPVDTLSMIASVMSSGKGKAPPAPAVLKRRAVLRSAPKVWHDIGRIASLCSGARVRVNAGPSEGRTPLLSACERGRVEVGYMLLTHDEFDPLDSGTTGCCAEDFGGVGSNQPLGAPPPFPRQKVDVNLCPTGSHTPLCAACLRGDETMTLLLLRWGAAVNQLGKKDQTPLVVAARAGHDSVVKVLLKYRLPRPLAEAVDVEASAQQEMMAKREARRAAAVGAVDLKIAAAGGKGGKPSAKSPVLGASLDGPLGKSYDFGSTGSLGGSPLRDSGGGGLDEGTGDGEGTKDGAFNTLFNLLGEEDSEDEKRPKQGDVAAPGAGGGGGDAGDRVGHPPRSPRGYPSHFDARKRQREAAERAAQLARDASMPHRDPPGSQKVQAIISSETSPSRMGALPDHDLIDVNLGDESGYTPLYVAATAGTVSIVNLLLAGGANIGISTKRNKTALYAAVEKGNRRVVAALLPKCTCEDLRKRTNYGTDVLHIADRNGNRVIKEMLYSFLRLQEMLEKEKLEKDLEEKKAAERAGGKRKKEQAAIMSRLASIGGGKPKGTGNSSSALFGEEAATESAVSVSDIKQIINQSKAASQDQAERRRQKPVQQPAAEPAPTGVTDATPAASVSLSDAVSASLALDVAPPATLNALASVGAFPPSQPEDSAPIDAAARLLELEKQRKARRDEILAKRKEMINAARAHPVAGPPSSEVTGDGHPSAASSILAAILTPTTVLAPSSSSPAPSPTTNTADPAAVRAQRLAYFEKKGKGVETSSDATPIATYVARPTTSKSNTGRPPVPSAPPALPAAPAEKKEEDNAPVLPSASPLRNQRKRGKAAGRPAVPPRASRDVTPTATAASVTYDSEEEEELQRMLMAPRPGYHPGSEGGEEEGEGRSSGGEDPVASRHRRRGRDSSVGSDSCGESAEPNPAGFTLPVMYPPGSKDRHKQPILRQKDVVAMKLREQQQYERMNRLTYGKSSPYGVPSEVPSLPVTRGVRSLLRFASSGEVSKVSDEEEGEGVGGEGEEEVDEEQEGSTRRSGDRSKQPSIRRSRRRRSPGVGVPTMSKADRLDPFAIIKRYELRAQLDRERRRLQQLQYQVNAARGSGVEHSSPEGDEGSGDGASAVSPGAIPTDGPAGGIALSGTKRSTSLRSHSGPLVHSQSALALSAPSGGDLTLPVPASPIMGSSPRSEYSEEFDSEGEESAPVAPGVGGVGATPRPVSEPAPVTNQPVLSPVQQPFYTTSEGSKVSPDPPAPKSLGKREKPTPFMATGSTPQLPPQLLASLRESGRSDSGLNLRMALRSFTHAWTNVDVPKPLLDRRQKSHRPKKASEAAEEGTVDIGSSVVKMPAINSKSWSQGLSVKK